MSLTERTPSIDELDVRYRRHRRGAWTAALVWGVAVSTLHFAGLAYGIYTEIWWWDLLTHSTSGFGVAALLYLAWTDGFRSRLGLFVVLPVCVLCVGTWFEVYERLFRNFWWGWSLSFYLQDTGIDLVLDTAGALAFGAVLRLYGRLRRERASSASPAADERQL
ncbi:hypothetical protein [Salinigranum marinum]|uniref:hypothetical protein n=1 Tax=Salinigranum marinum TaxID=1515595 RepID=UPI002989BC55|nr:hypothetical protein [Salinigranum marinum]